MISEYLHNALASAWSIFCNDFKLCLSFALIAGYADGISTITLPAARFASM
jgi:hypothetical protein